MVELWYCFVNCGSGTCEVRRRETPHVEYNEKNDAVYHGKCVLTPTGYTCVFTHTHIFIIILYLSHLILNYIDEELCYEVL